MHLALFNFIVYHFASERVCDLVIYNCWNEATTYGLAKVITQQQMYAQYVSINRSGTNISQPKRRTNVVGIFLDLNCWRTEDVVRTFKFRQHYRALVYDNGQWSLSAFHELIASSKQLSIDADLTYARGDSSQHTFTLYDVYSNGQEIGGSVNITSDREIVCSSTKCEHLRFLSALHTRPKYGNRNRLTDVTMRVAIVTLTKPPEWSVESKLEFLHTIANRKVDTIARFGFHMLMLLQELLQCNYSYNFHYSWSRSEIHGGIVGDVVNGTADLTSAPYLATPYRANYTNPLTGAHDFAESCFFRTSRYTAIRKTAFLKPFNRTVWTIIGCCIVVFAVSLWSAFHLECWLNAAEVPAQQRPPSMLTTLLISLGSACVQSSNLLPNSLGGRIAYFSLSLITYIIYNYYTSIVVSSLLNSPAKSSVQTLGQLAESSMQVGFQHVPYTLSYLNTSNQPDVRLLVKRKLESKRWPYLPQEQGMLKVRDRPGYVYVIEFMTGYLMIEQYFEDYQICDLNEVPLRPKRTLFTHVNKNSTYSEVFRLRYLRMLETGVYRKHRVYWVHEALKCYTRNYVINVGMEYTAPLFIILAAGYALVLLLLLAEICFAKRPKHLPKHK